MNVTVGELATTRPASVKVFQKHGIDFCCGGGKTLADACAKRGLDVDAVLGEIASAETQRGSDLRWDGAPLPALIDHLLVRYHRPLDVELPRIEQMARRVNLVHGDKDPERLAGILDTFLALKDDLEQHMMKEEDILFPWILDGGGANAGGPIEVMLQEHDAVGEMLRTLRRLTDDYVAPDGACNTWRALWHALSELEIDLHEHIHLENNVLFPRALAGG